ncbi:hypothetical protein VCHC40A1_1508, partial [Vibrio cholerae HC-40A1]
MRQSHEA